VERTWAAVPLRVLVADDCADTAESLALLLRMWGLQTVVAHDGPGAAAAARDFPPDIALLDLDLPGFDGIEVARRVRAQDPGGEPLLVALTGHAEERYRRAACEAGFHFFLVKPVEPRELHAVLLQGAGAVPAGAAAG
jgi:CheY-like chemotaxis protein